MDYKNVFKPNKQRLHVVLLLKLSLFSHCTENKGMILNLFASITGWRPKNGALFSPLGNNCAMRLARQCRPVLPYCAGEEGPAQWVVCSQGQKGVTDFTYKAW